MHQAIDQIGITIVYGVSTALRIVLWPTPFLTWPINIKVFQDVSQLTTSLAVIRAYCRTCFLKKMPSEMEVAQRYKLLTLLTMLTWFTLLT